MYSRFFKCCKNMENQTDVVLSHTQEGTIVDFFLLSGYVEEEEKDYVHGMNE